MSGTLLSESRPIARKQHICQSCERQIEPGTRYIDQRVAGDGSVWTWREHVECHDIYWRIHRENELWDDDMVDPIEVRRELDSINATEDIP